jgi:uncharacterized protein YkwD
MVHLSLFLFFPVFTYAETDAEDLLKLHNSYRQKIAIPSLCLNYKLMTAAEKFCQYMEETNDFNHVSRNGSTPEKRLEEVGYSWKSYGENIAFGQSNTNEVMAAWIGSTGHRENIIEPNFEEAGFAHCGLMDHSFWVSIFGSTDRKNCIP